MSSTAAKVILGDDTSSASMDGLVGDMEPWSLVEEKEGNQCYK